MHSGLRHTLSKAASGLVCLAAILGAGCHGTPNTSGYGIAWVSVTDEPGDYAAYIVTVDSINLTRSDGVVITAVATPEIVDFTQVHNIAELWSSGAIPIGTYVSATITLDYTNADIAVMVNGAPVTATVLDYVTRAAPTNYAVTVNFDPQNEPNITPTYASTSAALLSIDIDLAASGIVDLTTATPKVYVRPYLTIGSLQDNTRLIRVRGPLANSSTDVSTYTVYIRPFYDEANNLGQVSLFSAPTTVYTLNGHAYVGSGGLAALSVLSAGTTMTAGFTTFQPDYNPLNGAYAGRFNLQYVVAGSTLEDNYTEGISGNVIARSGNTLTLRGSTLFLNTADEFLYCSSGGTTGCIGPDTQVLLGPGTIVTADDNSSSSNLGPDSIAVGDFITARGIYSVTGANVTVINAEGSSTNTGSVRLQPSEVFGTLVSAAAGNLVMNASTINDWPSSIFDFAGNGATAPVPSAFAVDTNGLTLPAGTAAGDPVFAYGYATPFGTAPPDFLTTALNNEASVQVAGGPLGGGGPTTPGTGGCGIGSEVCDPAVMQVIWSGTGTQTPFAASSALGFTIDLTNTTLATAVIRIGAESIDMKSLPASPSVGPTSLPVTQIFAPRYSWGNPVTSTTTATVPTSTTTLKLSSNFATFVTGVVGSIDTANPAEQMVARGIYDRATNTFTATSIDFVL